MGIKISALPAIVTPALTDIFPVVQSGVTYKETVTQLSTLIGTVSVTSITGTANQVIASSPTGAVTLSLPQSIATASDVTFDSLTFSNTAKGIVGTTTNDSAGAGFVGQLISSVIPRGTPVSLTTATATDIASISLTAGDWDVWGNFTAIPAATTTVTALTAWISSTSATVPDGSLSCQLIFAAGFTPANDIGFCVPQRRFSVAAPTTIYLTAAPAFGTSTMTGCGGIYARRRR